MSSEHAADAEFGRNPYNHQEVVTGRRDVPGAGAPRDIVDSQKMSVEPAQHLLRLRVKNLDIRPATHRKPRPVGTEPAGGAHGPICHYHYESCARRPSWSWS